MVIIHYDYAEFDLHLNKYLLCLNSRVLPVTSHRVCPGLSQLFKIFLDLNFQKTRYFQLF